MKIFNIENGHEKVYVQREDIAMLNKVDVPYPGVIYTRILDHGVMVVDNSNKDEFIGFTEPDVIEFFKSQDWIIDYKQYRKLKETDLIVAGQAAAEEKNEVSVAYNTAMGQPHDRVETTKEAVLAKTNIISDLVSYLLSSDKPEYKIVGEQIINVVEDAFNSQTKDFPFEQFINTMKIACQGITKDMAFDISHNTIAVNANFSPEKLSKYVENKFVRILTKKNILIKSNIIDDIVSYLVSSENTEYKDLGNQINKLVDTALDEQKYNLSNAQLANLMKITCQGITKDMALDISQNTIAINASFSPEKLSKYIENEFARLLAKRSQVKSSLTSETISDPEQMLLRRELLDYKMHSIAKIIQIKRGNYKLNFPVVPDSDGFKMDGNYNSVDFQLSGALSPYTYLLYRKDLQPLSSVEIVPENLIRSGLEISIAEKMEDDFFIGDFERECSLTGDSKYLIINYKIEKVKTKEEYKGFIRQLFKKKDK